MQGEGRSKQTRKGRESASPQCQRGRGCLESKAVQGTEEDFCRTSAPPRKQADVRLPRPHRHVLEPDEDQVIELDAAGPDAPLGLGHILLGLVFHLLRWMTVE